MFHANNKTDVNLVLPAEIHTLVYDSAGFRDRFHLKELLDNLVAPGLKRLEIPCLTKTMKIPLTVEELDAGYIPGPVWGYTQELLNLPNTLKYLSFEPKYSHWRIKVNVSPDCKVHVGMGWAD